MPDPIEIPDSIDDLADIREIILRIGSDLLTPEPDPSDFDQDRLLTPDEQHLREILNRQRKLVGEVKATLDSLAERLFAKILVRAMRHGKWGIDERDRVYPMDRDAETRLAQFARETEAGEWSRSIVVRSGDVLMWVDLDDDQTFITLELGTNEATGLNFASALQIDLDIRGWIEGHRKKALAEIDRKIEELQNRRDRLVGEEP